MSARPQCFECGQFTCACRTRIPRCASRQASSEPDYPHVCENYRGHGGPHNQHGLDGECWLWTDDEALAEVTP